MSTKKRKVYDPNPIHPANQQSLKQQQSSLRNFITKSQENQKSLITIKFEQQQHQPESQYIDLTTNHDDSTTNLSLITSTYNNNVHDNSWSVTIEQSSTSVTNGNNNNSNQPNNNTSHLVSTHNVSSYSVNSLDDSDYHCDFNLRDIKQQYKPNRPSPHRNQPSPPSPPPSKDNANIGDDQSGGKSGNHNESTTNHGGSSNDDDSIHDSDSDTEGGHTLHSESSRSEDTDSNISQEYSIITESLHYLDDASHHDEIVHCQQCNVITSVIIWDASDLNKPWHCALCTTLLQPPPPPPPPPTPPPSPPPEQQPQQQHIKKDRQWRIPLLPVAQKSTPNPSIKSTSNRGK